MMVFWRNENIMINGSVATTTAANIWVYAPVLDAWTDKSCKPVASVYMDGRYINGVK